MKKIGIHLKREKSKTGKTFSKSKSMAVSYSNVSKHRIISSGGLTHIEICRSHMTGNSIKFMRASSKKENTYGIFIAGGDEIDQLVASANEKIYLITPKPVVKKKLLVVLRDFFQQK